MANLRQAVQMANLKEERKPTKTMSRNGVAKRVFELAAKNGTPFTGLTYKQWAKKWLASDTFVLTDIGVNQAAMPAQLKSPDAVIRHMHASAMEPIVVDVNKRKVGGILGGFIPPVIAVDGKHRRQAAMNMGRARIEAWVGTRALRLLNASAKVDVSKVIPNRGTKLDSAAILATSVPSQFKPVKGSAPHMAMPGVKPRTINPDGSKADVRVYSQDDSSDVTPHHDPSDRTERPYGKSQDPSDQQGPFTQGSPGSGVGPKIAPAKGGSKSEVSEMSFARMCGGRKGCVDAGPIKLSQIRTEFMKACSNGYKPSMKGKAAPGWEGTIKEMKQRHPDIDNPWALTNWMDDQGYTPGGKGKK